MFRILSSITHPALPLRTYSDLDLTNAEVSVTDFREFFLVWIWAAQQLPKFDNQGRCIGFVGKSGHGLKQVLFLRWWISVGAFALRS